MKKTASYRLTVTADRWLTEQAKKRGISKNDVMQELINEAVKQENHILNNPTNLTNKDGETGK